MGTFFVLRNGGRTVKEYGLISFLHTGHLHIIIFPFSLGIKIVTVFVLLGLFREQKQLQNK